MHCARPRDYHSLGLNEKIEWKNVLGQTCADLIVILKELALTLSWCWKTFCWPYCDVEEHVLTVLWYWKNVCWPYSDVERTCADLIVIFKGFCCPYCDFGRTCADLILMLEELVLTLSWCWKEHVLSLLNYFVLGQTYADLIVMLEELTVCN